DPLSAMRSAGRSHLTARGQIHGADTAARRIQPFHFLRLREASPFFASVMSPGTPFTGDSTRRFKAPESISNASSAVLPSSAAVHASHCSIQALVGVKQ